VKPMFYVDVPPKVRFQSMRIASRSCWLVTPGDVPVEPVEEPEDMPAEGDGVADVVVDAGLCCPNVWTCLHRSCCLSFVY
jgi:hypothetical protein